jgi:hypothetical protein
MHDVMHTDRKLAIMLLERADLLEENLLQILAKANGEDLDEDEDDDEAEVISLFDRCTDEGMEKYDD